MLARVQLTLAAVLALAALALGGVYLFGPDGGIKAAGAPALTVGPYGYVGALAPPDVRPRDFTLPDEDGRPVSLAADRGRVVLMTFMYSTCQDSCPATAQTIRLALDQVGAAAKGMPVYAISVDPSGDTETSTRRFLLKQSLLGRMHFLRGTEAQLAPVWRQYGVQKQGNGSKQFDDHTISVLIIGRDGRQRVSLPLDNLSPEAVAHDLRRVLGSGATR